MALFENRSNGCRTGKGTCEEYLDTIERARGCEGPRQLRASCFSFIYILQVDSTDADFLIPDNWSHPLLPTKQEGVKCYLVDKCYYARSLFLYCSLHRFVLASTTSLTKSACTLLESGAMM